MQTDWYSSYPWMIQNDSNYQLHCYYTAADTHRDGCNSLLFLLPLLKLLVHDTALNKNMLGSSSLVIVLNNPVGKISDTLYCAKNTQQYTFKWLINHLIVNLSLMLLAELC